MTKYLVAGLFLLITATFSGEAKAQFKGDVFFETPSISVNSGDDVSLTIAAFTGVDVFGAADIAVSYDASLFALKAVSYPDGLTGLSDTSTDAGIMNVRIISANGTSGEQPPGVASFVTLTGTVLASPGTVFNLTTQNQKVLLSDRSEITNDGFAAEVSVAASSMQSSRDRVGRSGNVSLTAKPGSALYERARRVSPHVGLVTLAEPDGSYVDVILLRAEE